MIPLCNVSKNSGDTGTRVHSLEIALRRQFPEDVGERVPVMDEVIQQVGSSQVVFPCLRLVSMITCPGHCNLGIFDAATDAP